MSDITNSRAASRVQDKLNDLFESKLTPGKAYIKFQLASNIAALLSMDRVEESMIVEADQLTALPGMPKSAIGIMSSRDRVFCVFDLSQLLALPSSLINPRQYSIVVLQTTNEPPINVGFAVNQLQGIVRFLDEDIKSSLDGVPDSFVDCVSGTIQQEFTSTIPILKLDSILASLNQS